jgi:hypothetical protein
MSYSEPEDNVRAPGSARNWKARTPRTPRGSVDDTFQQECQKVQEAVQKIQQHAADVRKETNMLSTSPGHTGGKAKAQAAMRDAKTTFEGARNILQSLGNGLQTLPVEEQNCRRFMQQKLTDNLQVSLKALEAAGLAFETAEATCARQQAAAAYPSVDDKKVPLVTAGDPSVDPALAPGADADLEAARQSAQELEQDYVPPETEIHAAIVDEYARELTTLNQDVRALQRAMVDLAEHATAQGEVLDNLENNMAAAADSTAQANEQIGISNEQQQRSSKRFMWLVVVAGSLAAVGAMLT